MTFDQFHRDNVASAWHKWNPPSDLPKWESGAHFIAFIREMYKSSQRELSKPVIALKEPKSFEQSNLFNE